MPKNQKNIIANQGIKLTARNGCGLTGKLFGAAAYTYRYTKKKKMKTFETAILRIMYAHGTEVSTSQIYRDIEAGKFFKLQEHHLKDTIYGGRPAYQHEVRSYLSNMVQDGLIERLARGIYRITGSGKRRIGVNTE